MKPHYNLRTQSAKMGVTPVPKTTNTSTRISKKQAQCRSMARVEQQKRRHSLRLMPLAKVSNNRSTTMPKWRQAEVDDDNEENSPTNDDTDDYDELLARHHRHMLEEQKDRKLYERYVRDQRTLRRLQCRRTHTAHLNEATRTRLLRELERERRFVVQDMICAYLDEHTIIFRHGSNSNGKKLIDWSTLEQEIPQRPNVGVVHELNTMINNLKRVIRISKSAKSQPRLSVHERRKKRLAADAPILPTVSDISPSTEIGSSAGTTTATVSSSSQPPLISSASRFPIVRFVDNENHKMRTSNSQHLTCIQNVLLHHNNGQSNRNHHGRVANPNDTTTSRKPSLRSKAISINSDFLPTKKRPLEKENCNHATISNLTNIPQNLLLKVPSSMALNRPSSSRPYPNTRKHPVTISSSTRRQTRLSTNA